MTPEEAKQKAEAFNEKLNSLESNVKNAATKEDLDLAKQELDTLKNSVEKNSELEAKFNDLKEVIKTQGETISGLQKNKEAVASDSVQTQIVKGLEANLEKLKSFKNHENEHLNLVLETKAPALMTTGNSTLQSPLVAAFGYQDESTFVRNPIARPFVTDYTDNGSTNVPAIKWVEETTREGDAEFIGEGIVKPLIDFDFETRMTEAKKVAGKIKVSEEALDDIPFLAAEINNKLRERHDLKLQDGILSGNGTGSNLNGIIPQASAFVPGALALSVSNPNNYDVIVACNTQIAVASENAYMADVIFVNPQDAALMKLEKDSNNNYLRVEFATPDGQVIHNVRVVTQTRIPVGDFLIGDMKKSRVRTYKPFSIRVGYTNDDFEKNLVTILGESRVHHFIANNEKRAFVYGNFAAAKVAITKP